MPKENVFQRTEHGDPDTSKPIVTVGWSKEAGHVEIATKAVDGLVLEPTPEGNGWFVQLDRVAANRLIRLLRKARDQAYGSDA